uniref:kelch repeat and BTB domain-containing protein 13 n=1 Tax=Gasterosteus aculeatus aculeatus TaxID=481459 RepID=UPI001A99C628|nr:kelch repeat and BTB domain-containing protein 13 [Gasterosteus aculeatus aculeatus]
MESNSCSSFSQQPRQRQPPENLRVNIDGRSFAVDKTILSEKCEYFRALFQSGMRECQQEEIQLQCVGVLGFQVMLQVLGGKHPMLSSDQIVEAIECAAFLQVPALTEHLINIVNSENCLLIYHTAATYGVGELSYSSALFIRDMYPELKEEVHTLPKKMVDYIESLLPSSYMAVCSHSPSTEQLKDLQRTVCYLDEDNSEWKVLTHLPVSTSTTMAGVAVLDNKLYIIGGVHDITKEGSGRTGFCYNPAANTWVLHL